MDVKFVRPYFRDGVLTAFVADTGHWPDVGGMSPGGFSPAATDVYQEGLRLPPVKIYEAGTINQALVDVMMLNMRVPEERYGDMAAQINRAGTRLPAPRRVVRPPRPGHHLRLRR